MTLTVAPEPGYDSFVSVADADAYVAAMGLLDWPNEELKKEVALRRGTQYIQTKYKPDAKYLEPMHKNIQAATVEAALRSTKIDLLGDVDPTQIIKREKVGPIDTEYAIDVGTMPSFPLIDSLMEGLGISQKRSGVMMLKRV